MSGGGRRAVVSLVRAAQINISCTMLIIALTLLLVLSSFQASPLLETLFEWSKLEYVEEYDNYITENNILGNVRWHKDVFYVCVPRWRNGVPATLNTVDASTSKLRPFPNLASNKVGQCETALQNVAT